MGEFLCSFCRTEFVEFQDEVCPTCDLEYFATEEEQRFEVFEQNYIKRCREEYRCFDRNELYEWFAEWREKDYPPLCW